MALFPFGKKYNLKDMASNMIFLGKQGGKCECCGDYKMGGEIFKWITPMTKRTLRVCKKCAIRETFGNKYKINNSYQQWVKRSKK